MEKDANAMRRYLFKFSDGEIVAEKCRNTFGGYSNLMKRLEVRFGPMRLVDAELGFVVEDRRTFTITEV